MRIAIATVQTPFLEGGAELHAQGLKAALHRAGHTAEIVTAPFRFAPCREVRRSMDLWATERFDRLNGYEPDRVICLRFPAYGLSHPNKVVWLLHQHRAVYELWDQTLDAAAAEEHEELRELGREIRRFDTAHLSEARAIFTNSATVSSRLDFYNGLDSTPLYHPPPLAADLYTGDPLPFVFCPSRLESLKRQDLLIQAMAHVRSPQATVLIAGTGGQKARYEALIRDYGVEDKVRLMGRISRSELLAAYAQCLGVFFGPFDEDYGYVTLEAMAAAKPVITCTDSGGPLEFVQDGATGFVAAPNPEAVAACIDRLFEDHSRAVQLGRQGRERYQALGISWEAVVHHLLGP